MVKSIATGIGILKFLQVLVHFDADDRVWSLDPKQLAAA